MSLWKRYSFWIEHEQAAGLKAVKERDGVPESEQIRRAIDAWLEAQGVMGKAARKRVAPRKPA
jgi:Ribbon-helix-helix domain